MQKTYNTLIIVYSAFVFSSLVYLIVGFALSQSQWKAVVESESLHKILFVLFVVLSASAMAAAIKIRSSAFSQEIPHPETLEQLQRYVVSRSILTFAFSEIPAILGLVLFLLSGRFPYLVILCILSIVSFLLIKPAQETLEELERRYF